MRNVSCILPLLDVYKRQNLNPGKYTLVIKSQRDGIKEAKLLIIVLPSWYETWWAYLIYTIVTILSLIHIYSSFFAVFIK